MNVSTQDLLNKAKNYHNSPTLHTLKELTEVISQYFAEPPERVCSSCNIAESEADYLIDVRVIIQDGEEGFADITQYFCDLCYTTRQVGEKLIELGFKDHRHGSTNMLEAEGCGGYSDCETPSYYGRYYAGQVIPQDPSLAD